jgi:hypothetical protein
MAVSTMICAVLFVLLALKVMLDRALNRVES